MVDISVCTAPGPGAWAEEGVLKHSADDLRAYRAKGVPPGVPILRKKTSTLGPEKLRRYADQYESETGSPRHYPHRRWSVCAGP